MAYGSRTRRTRLKSKKARGTKRAEALSTAVAADRSVFNAKAAPINRDADHDLLDAMESSRGAVLHGLVSEELPEVMQCMDRGEQRVFLEQKKADRGRIRREIQKLAGKRATFVREKAAASGKRPESSFDAKVIDTVRSQMGTMLAE